jgi:hypothetical protein
MTDTTSTAGLSGNVLFYGKPEPLSVEAHGTLGVLYASSLAIHAGLVVATCGPYVPPFAGATVAEVVAKVRAYNCRWCGTGGAWVGPWFWPFKCCARAKP